MQDVVIDDSHKHYIGVIANGICLSKPWMFDDAVQEGLIAYWEAWQHQPGNKGYCFGAARLRMKGFVGRGDHAFGAPSRQGKQQVTEQRVAGDASIEDYESNYAEIEAELAYHRVEIAKVVSQLTTRQQQVIFKVAFDQAMNSSQRGEWSGRLRPRLEEELGHLRNLVSTERVQGPTTIEGS